jgi:23S rRNA (uridine2552-2'-O)-methyltransferase
VSGAKGTGAGKGGARGDKLKQHVKTAHKRSHSSTQWLQRQLNDPYVARAKAEGLRSRAAFKLTEIDDRYRLLKSGHVIVDLGAAPGGWCQVAAERIGLKQGRGRVVGIDLLEIEPIPGVDLLLMDFTEDDAPAALLSTLGLDEGARGVDGVLSDMAANTVGHKRTDHLKIIALAEMALAFARDVLKPGGYFLTKLFQGGETHELVTDLKRDFAVVRHVKPAASRADSSEVYVLATGFRGN